MAGGRAGVEDVSFHKCVTKGRVRRKGRDVSWLAGRLGGDVCATGLNLLMRKIYPSCLWWGKARDECAAVWELALAPCVLHLPPLRFV